MSIFKVALVVLVLLLGYLLLLPVSIAPVAWTPTPVASLPPPTSLRAIQRIEPVLPDFVGPEGIAADTEGRIYAGLGDGRLLRLSADFGSCTLLDNSGGRPLGLAVSSDGALLIADARSGLLSLDRDGQLRTLSDRADGVAYGFTDDVTVTADGSMVYFTDASARFGFGQHMEDLLEHGRTGRLLRYDVAANKAETLMQDRAFANGVALGPDEAYVVFAETWEYKLTRYWLKGEKAGQSDTLVDGLPGFPDNLSFNGRDASGWRSIRRATRCWIACCRILRCARSSRVCPKRCDPARRASHRFSVSIWTVASSRICVTTVTTPTVTSPASRSRATTWWSAASTTRRWGGSSCRTHCRRPTPRRRRCVPLAMPADTIHARFQSRSR